MHRPEERHPPADPEPGGEVRERGAVGPLPDQLISQLGMPAGESREGADHRGLAVRAGGGPVDPEQALVWLAQAAEALDAAHGHGIVHRDVKPANLLFDSSDRLQVVDFGIARVVDETAGMTAPGTVLGTAGYLAPEQVAGAAPDPRQDLYAVGVVATQLLLGRPPRPGRAPMVPEGLLRPLVTALVDPDPTMRPPTAGAALERLRRIEIPADGPWPVVPDRLGDLPSARSDRWATTVIVVSLLVIGLCALAVWLMLR